MKIGISKLLKFLEGPLHLTNTVSFSEKLLRNHDPLINDSNNFSYGLQKNIWGGDRKSKQFPSGQIENFLKKLLII